LRIQEEGITKKIPKKEVEEVKEVKEVKAETSQPV
jgi:nitrogen fixation protein